MFNTMKGLDPAAVTERSDDPQTIHFVKVSSAAGQRIIISVPVEQMEGFQSVLVRGARDGCSAQVASLIERLQYADTLDKVERSQSISTVAVSPKAWER